MLKNYRVESAGGHVVVAHKTLLSAPVGIGIRGLGLGLDKKELKKALKRSSI